MIYELRKNYTLATIMEWQQITYYKSNLFVQYRESDDKTFESKEYRYGFNVWRETIR